jgi:hypothetical protein
MNIIIKDLTQSEKVPNINPIKLTACLQSSRDKDGNYFFFESTYKDVSIRTITRLAKNVVKGHDLILVNENNLFLGHWNDGVL